MEDEIINEEVDEGAENVAEEDTVEAEEPAPEDEAEEEDLESEEDDDKAYDVDELEYDENGDVIIPEDIDEEDASKEGEDKEDEEPTKTAPDGDDELSRLREELERLKSQSKDTLKKLGIEKDDVMEGLAELAAETEDMTTEEYLEKRQKEYDAEKAERQKKVEEFEALAAADLTVLKQNFPETKGYKHIKDMPAEVLKKFADYRNKGVPAKEAYAAANVDGIRAGVATSAKKSVKNDSKSHLRSSQPKGGRNNGTYITQREMNMWREMFPNKSDREIVALYKKTK